MTRGQFRAAPRFVVFDGQSLNTNPYGLPPSAWPYKTLNSTTTPYAEVWVSGLGWSSLAQTRATRVDPKGNSGTLTGLSMMGDTTSIALGIPGATAYATQRTYAAAARAAGYDKVVNFTLPPSTTFTAPQETQRQALNALIIGNAEGTWDAIVNLTTDSRIESDPADPLYYIDGTHLQPATHTIIAALAVPAFTSVGLIA